MDMQDSWGRNSCIAEDPAEDLSEDLFGASTRATAVWSNQPGPRVGGTEANYGTIGNDGTIDNLG